MFFFPFFQQVLAYFISGTFHNSWSAVERKFFSYSSLSIYFTLLNSIVVMILLWKRWKNGILDRSCVFFFLLLTSELRLFIAGLWLYVLWFCSFFSETSKTHCSICQELFTSLLFLNDYLTTHDICWSFSPFSFPFTWPYFFSRHFLLKSSAIHRFRNQLYFPGKSSKSISTRNE